MKRSTKGIEVGARASGNLWKGKIHARPSTAPPIEHKSRILASGFRPQQKSGTFLTASTADVPVRWKHAAFVQLCAGPVGSTRRKIYSGDYKDACWACGTVVSTPNWDPDVRRRITYNLILPRPASKNLAITGGIKTCSTPIRRSRRCIRLKHRCR